MANPKIVTNQIKMSKDVQIRSFVFLYFLILVNVSCHSHHTHHFVDNESIQNDQVNKAFKQMSKYCFEDVDCKKCSDSFHDSAADVQSTIFRKFKSSNDLASTVNDAISSVSSTFKDRLLEGCKALIETQAKMENTDNMRTVLFTNYSGTSTNQGVFLTTFYSVVPQANELHDSNTTGFMAALPVHPISNPNSPSSDPSAQYRDPKVWAEQIPQKHRHFSNLGQIYQNQQKRFSEKYTGATDDKETHQKKVLFLIIPDHHSSFSSQATDGSSATLSELPMSKTRHNTDVRSATQTFPAYKYDGFTLFNLSSILDTDGFKDIEEFFKSKNNTSNFLPSSFNTFRLVPYNVSSNSSIVQLPNNNSTVLRFQIPVSPKSNTNGSSWIAAGMDDSKPEIAGSVDTSLLSFEIPSATNGEVFISIPSSHILEVFHQSNVSPSMDSIEAYDIAKLKAYRDSLPIITNSTDITNPAMWLLFGDVNRLLAITLINDSFDFNQFFNQLDRTIQKGKESDHEVMNKGNEKMSYSLEQVKKSISDAGRSIGHRLKSAVDGSISDLQSAGNDILSSIKSAYDHQPNSSLHSNAQIFKFPSKRMAIATPLSFYVEIKEDRISHLEQIPPIAGQENILQLIISNANYQTHSALHSLRNVIEGYWDKFINGSCTDVMKFISTKFEGVDNQFDFHKFLQQPQQFASNRMEDLNGLVDSAKQFIGQNGIRSMSDQEPQSFVSSSVSKPSNKKDRTLHPETAYFGFLEPQSLVRKSIMYPIWKSNNYENQNDFNPGIESIINYSKSNNLTKKTNMLLQNDDIKENDSTSSETHFTLVKACETAKAQNLFGNLNVLYVHELFFNLQTHHGVASVSFSNNRDDVPASVEFLDIGPTSKNDLEKEFDRIYGNLTEMFQDSVQDKMEKGRRTINELKSANEEKIDEFKKKIDLFKEKIDKFKEYVKSATKEYEAKKDQMLKDLTEYISEIEEYVTGMNNNTEMDYHQLQKGSKKIRNCNNDYSDCIHRRIQQMQPYEAKRLVTFFKSTPDRKKITKMVNFEAVRHDDKELVLRLETTLFPGSSNSAISPAALAIYGSLAVAMFLAWVWTRLTRKPEALMAYAESESPLTAADQLGMNEPRSYTNYYRMHDP